MNTYNVDGWEQCVTDSQYLLPALTLSKSTLVQSFSTHFLKGTGSWHKLIQIVKQNNRGLIPSGLNKHLLPLLLNRFNSFSCKKNTIQSLNTPCNLSLCHVRTTNKPASKTLNATTAAWLAQLGERQSAAWDVADSNPLINNQGLKLKSWEESAAFVMTFADGYTF